MRGDDTLLKDILVGRMKGNQQTGRPRWMMNIDNGCSYQNLKEMTRCKRTWRDWCLEPALGQRRTRSTSGRFIIT